MNAGLGDRLADILGRCPRRIEPLSGGDVGAVYQITLSGGDRMIAKTSRPGSPNTAEIEARMLQYLDQHSQLPVPRVEYAEDDLLVMEHLPASDAMSDGAERDAARHVAAMHAVTAGEFGLAFDTVIGPLHQPNPKGTVWLDFFREHRLVYMAHEASKAGRLAASVVRRIEHLVARLDGLISEPSAPALLHGDLWGGNILVHTGRVSGFIDPAIYYGDPEMDLAFLTLFASVGSAFFDEYQQLRPIPPGFFEERRHIYNLWPLLVHVRLFGGSYAASVEQTLTRFGC